MILNYTFGSCNVTLVSTAFPVVLSQSIMEPQAVAIFHIWCSSTRTVLCDVSQPIIILRDDWAARVAPESLCPQCAAKWRVPDATEAERRLRQRARPILVPAQAR